MSGIYNAIANAGANAGQGISNYFANRYQVQRDQMLDQEAQAQNAFVMQDRQFQYKQEIMKQAAIVYAGGGDPIAYINSEAPKYDINEPADERVMPYIQGMAQQLVGSEQSGETERLISRLPPDQQAQAIQTALGLAPKAENQRPQRPVRVVGEDGVARWVSPEEAVGQVAVAPEVGPDFDTEQKLRKEFDSLTKDYRQQEAAMGRIIASAKDPSAAGDLALIFNYMKMLDPGSTVREGEFANAQNAGSAFTRVGALYNNIVRGERLTQAQRADFLNQAGAVYREAANSYDQIRGEYRTLSEQYGAAPDRVGIRAPRYDEEDYSSLSSGFQVGQVVNGYKFKGGDPKEEKNWERVK